MKRLHVLDRDAGAAHAQSPRGIRDVAARSIAAAHRAPALQRCWVVEEHALFVDVADVGTFTLMWTRTDAPGASGYLSGDGVLADTTEPDVLALATGFLFTEGVIDGIDDVAEMAVCPDAPDVLRVRLADPSRARTNRRGGLVASACGICGGVDRARQPGDGLAAVPDSLRLSALDLQQMMAAMESRQFIFNTTGGTHAAALFSAQREVIAAAEDLGRHNALDKVIGRRLLRRQSTRGCGVALSSRVSLEMIVKAARAGIELVAAVSAPTSLAIDTAQRLGITLCGFVRSGRMTAFTHPHRITASTNPAR